MNRHLLLSALAFGLCAATAGANLQSNGGFELGVCGYSTDRHLDPARNPSLEYIQPEADPDHPHSGKYSGKIANPHGEYYIFYGKEFELKKGVVYRVSGFVRADRETHPLEISMQHYSSKYKNQGPRIPFTAGKEWKEFSFDFQSPIDGPFFLHIMNSYEEGTVWFDDLSVTRKGDTAPDCPEAAFEVDQKELYAPEENREKFTARFRGAPGDIIPVVAIDDYTGERYEIDTVRLKGTDVEPFEMEWSPPKYGAYRLCAANDAYRNIEGYFVYFKPAAPVKFDLDRVMPGINGGLGVRGPWRFRSLGYESSAMTPMKLAELLGKTGVRLMRMHDDGLSSWALLEPEDGKFDFSYIDASHEMLNRNGVHLFMCIHSNDTFSKEIQGWSQNGFPAWLKKKACFVKDKGDNWQYFPPEAEWRRYVRTIAHHFREKGYAPAFEILNEPQFRMSAEEYMSRFLIPASEEIRKEWKEAKIVGICTTSDFGAKIGPFAQKCMELGAGNYIDAVSFHPYGSREINSSDPADRQIRTLKKLFGKYGREIPLWQDELYYLFDGPPMSEWYKSEQSEAQCIPIRYIIDIGEGCRQVTATSMRPFWRRMLIPSMEGFVCNEGTLSPRAIAFSVMSDFLTGATPTATLRPFPGCAAYVFRDRDGGEVAALWLYQNTEGAVLDLSEFEAWDMFGNRIAPGSYKPGKAPVWLRAKNGGGLAGLVKKVTVKFENPLSVSGITRYDGKRFLITVFNHGDSDVSGYVTGIGGEGLATQSAVSFSVKAKSSIPLSIPAVKDPKRTGRTVVSLYCNGKQNRFTTGFSRIGSAGPGKTMRIGGNAEGEFRVSGDKLILTLRVKDATNSGADNRADLWNQDGVELFVEPNPDDFSNDAKCANYTDSTFRIFLSPRLPEGKQLTVWNMANKELSAKDFDCRIVNTPAGYSATLEMPIGKLKLKNRLGLEIKVNDANAGTVSQAAWSSPEKVNEAWRDRSGFGLLEWQRKDEKK